MRSAGRSWFSPRSGRWRRRPTATCYGAAVAGSAAEVDERPARAVVVVIRYWCCSAVCSVAAGGPWGARRLLGAQLLISAVAMRSWPRRAGPARAGAGLSRVLGDGRGVDADDVFGHALLVRVRRAGAVQPANAVMSIGDQLPAIMSAAVARPAITALGAGRRSCCRRVPGGGDPVSRPLVPMRRRDSGRRPARQGRPLSTRARMPGPRSRRHSATGLAARGVPSPAPLLRPARAALPGGVRDQLHGNADGCGLLWTCFGLGSLAHSPPCRISAGSGRASSTGRGR